MYKRVGIVLAIICFLEIVSNGTGQTTGDDLSTGVTSGMTSAVPTTASNYADWEVICNGTFCSYNLHAPATDPEQLSQTFTSVNMTYWQTEGLFNNANDIASEHTSIIQGFINLLNETKQNLSSALIVAQDKLNMALVELNDINDTVSLAQCFLSQAAINIPCYAKCNATYSGDTACIRTTTTTTAGNVATCQCPGNLDPDSCAKVGCISKVNGGQVVNQDGPFWSPGYNGSSGTYEGNLDCQWIMSQAGKKMNITVNAFKTASDATLTIQTSTGNMALSGDLSGNLDLYNRRVQSTTEDATTVIFQFTNTNAGSPGDYFNIEFAFI
uniref:CUB domain-containing protein n=1 Tax=Plectus sambesii TaxID=2011161 RepID=A0A914XSL8_9BILA